MKTKKTDIGTAVVKYLLDMKWDVYQEVAIKHCGRADVVATQGKKLWVIECKINRSVNILGQAYRWIGHANYVSIATCSMYDTFYEDILIHFGIGAFRYQDYALKPSHYLSQDISPNLFRKRSDLIYSSLCDDQKTFADAGNNSGNYWSPLKSTCRNVSEYVNRNPGCGLRDMIRGIKTHYHNDSNAYSALYHWLRSDMVPGIKMIKEGKRLKLYQCDVL